MPRRKEKTVIRNGIEYYYKSIRDERGKYITVYGRTIAERDEKVKKRRPRFAFVAKLRNSQPSANVRRSGSPISPRISNGIPIIITSKSSAHISSPYLVISA